MVRREILAVFEGKQKGAITPKLERPRPPKLVCMHFMSTSTCMNFLSQFYFLAPMDSSPWLKGKFGRFEGKLKRGKISETGDTTPTKVDLHAFQTNLCLHEFFEPVLFFDPPWSFLVTPTLCLHFLSSFFLLIQFTPFLF